jgi:methyltransferase
VTPATGGPYRYIRHPNYAAVCLEFLALPLAGGATRSATSLSCLNAVVLACRIRAEERLLARSPAYRRAFEGRARFIPGVF